MTNNDTGRCVPHRYVLKTWGVCGAEGCGKRIRSDNTSGLCGPHLRVLKALDWHNARRARVAQLWVEDLERMRVLDDHNGICHLCGTEVGADWHMDHVIPIAMQGPHSYGNVAPAHPACNLRKQAYRPGSPMATVDAAARAAYLSFHGEPFTG